jgi:HAD superfamily hydrolase (TIGR01450 family)
MTKIQKVIMGEDMLGIILAAGVGSRLRPMTKSKPKCMVTTAGVPILRYQIDAYIEAGVAELIIVVGYEGDAIREYCKHIKNLSISILENSEYENTNNMYSLYLAAKLIGGRSFILNNADLSIDGSIVKRLIEHESLNAIAVDTSIYSEESMKITVGDNGFISDISKSIGEQQAFACSIDFYKFSAEAGLGFLREISRIIEDEKNLKDWTEVAMQRLFRASAMDFLPCDIAGLKWVEIDDYADLARSDRIFSGFDQVLESVDNVIFDLDGTVYVGESAVKGAAEAIAKLRNNGKKIFFLSNNSSKNKAEYVDKLARMEISVKSQQIILSSDGLIDYLHLAKVERVHVLGTTSFKKIILDAGFLIDSVNPEYVVIGYDTQLSYQKLITACKYINDGVDILATHCDIYCPSEYGPIPDIGALLEMIRLTTGKAAVRVFGKPNPDMVLPLVRDHGLDMDKTMMLGDRLGTDMLLAKKLGCHGLLVLTGESTRDEVENSKEQPDFVLDSIADI